MWPLESEENKAVRKELEKIVGESDLDVVDIKIPKPLIAVVRDLQEWGRPYESVVILDIKTYYTRAIWQVGWLINPNYSTELAQHQEDVHQWLNPSSEELAQHQEVLNQWLNPRKEPKEPRPRKEVYMKINIKGQPDRI